MNKPNTLSISVIVVMLLMTLLKSSDAQSVNIKTVTIGLIDYPPHIDLKKGVNQSKLYSYINKLFTSKGYAVTFKQFTNKRAKKELQKGTIDLLLPYDDDIDDGIKRLTKPIFHATPGLCFKKEKFIPILSASHRFNNLKIGIPASIDIVSVLRDSGAKLVMLQGDNVTNRGIDLTQRGRLDAFYHPSPLKMYHQNNQRLKEVVCSYFHGYANGVYIAARASMKQETFDALDKAFTQAINTLSYEYYFAK